MVSPEKLLEFLWNSYSNETKILKNSVQFLYIIAAAGVKKERDLARNEKKSGDG